MSIGKKLRKSFFLLVGLLVLLSVVNWISMAMERSAQNKTAKLFVVQRLSSEVGQQSMQNRDRLGSYLLTVEKFAETLPG